MAKRNKNLITIAVAEAAPKRYVITATFKDAPPITVDTKNPRQALMQVALQAAIYLVMKSQGQDTVAHAPIPRELRSLLKTI